ncbi:hypothetical protein [Erythrobacter sp. JK5]|uniref:hypothetical protein n=1 Tax=Erythrobacter sp. JK5 TaxID=2829500 RepID=UPI001BA55ABA|nr:hypothetical protein [Erythrobacter sp. JK5]QUL36824.1 hypothetical protein KDC96_10390 [Erythrobacter sp. JK5]
MLTKTPAIKHIEEVPVGSIFYYPYLGEGMLCLSARFDGQNPDRSTVVVPLSGEAPSSHSLHTVFIDNLSGHAAVVDELRAEVDLSSATNSENTSAWVAPDGLYVRLQNERPMMRQCLRLNDGVIRSSVPTTAIGFTRWKVVLDDDPNTEVWSSDVLTQAESNGV